MPDETIALKGPHPPAGGAEKREPNPDDLVGYLIVIRFDGMKITTKESPMIHRRFWPKVVEFIRGLSELEQNHIRTLALERTAKLPSKPEDKTDP